MTEGQLVCIAAEEDMIAATSSRVPYVEADEKVIECFFQSLEFVNAMYVKEGAKIPMPKLSKVTHLGIKQVPDKGPELKKDWEAVTGHVEVNRGNPEKRQIWVGIQTQ